MKKYFITFFVLGCWLTAEVARAGITSTYTYDKLGRLTQVQQSSGIVIAYTYDAIGNRTRKTITISATLDTDGDGIPDLSDSCPFKTGIACGTAIATPKISVASLADSDDFTATRNITLQMTSYTAVSEMRISDRSDFKGAVWKPFNAATPFTLSSGYGSKTVWTQFRDANGNVPSPTSTSLHHELGKTESTVGFAEPGTGDMDDTDNDPATHKGRVRSLGGFGVIYDGADTLYWIDLTCVKKYTLSNGNLVTLAGAPMDSGYKNGNGKAARFGYLSGGGTKFGDALYIVDDLNHALRKIDLLTNEVTTLTGPSPETPTTTPGFTDGTGSQARFNRIFGNCLTHDNTSLYLCDSFNHAIRKIDLQTGLVTTIAGNLPPQSAYGKRNGDGKDARFFYPYGIFFHEKSNSLIVADSCNGLIRKIDLAKKDLLSGNLLYPVTTFSGSGGSSSKDGNATSAQFVHCQNNGGGIDVARDILLLGGGGSTLRTLDLSSGAVTTVVGLATEGGFVDGKGLQARIDDARGPYASDGTFMYFSHHGALRKMDLNTFDVTTIQGTHPDHFAFLDGKGSQARLGSVYAMVADDKGNIYAADADSSALRKIDTQTWTITTVAGAYPKAIRGYADGVGTAARLFLPAPHTMAYDNGSLYFSDTFNCSVRKFDVNTGNVTTIAGSMPPTVQCGNADSTDGSGTTARFNWPRSVALDAAQNILYVVDGNNHRIRKIDLAKNNTVTTLAGSTVGFEDGIGAKAKFSSPRSLSLLSDGKLYVTDGGNHAIRSIDPATGLVQTVAGSLPPTSIKDFADGIGGAARFANPYGTFSNAAKDRLYIADYSNSAVRKLDIKTGEVTTIVGGPSSTDVKEGYLSETRTLQPLTGIMIDPTHMLLSEGKRLRKITFKETP